jgi:catechol 2,3-dioxygenase-like lactoylglutathione lyase family enzyme
MAVHLTRQAIDLAIVTTNGPAMLAFYRDVVGLKYLRELVMQNGVGVMHQMACGDSIIKLIVVDDTPVAAPQGGIQGAAGYRYWTMSVSNLTSLLETCAARGHKIVVKEHEMRPGVHVGMVEDPDGNWVEFLAIAPNA